MNKYMNASKKILMSSLSALMMMSSVTPIFAKEQVQSMQTQTVIESSIKTAKLEADLKASIDNHIISDFDKSNIVTIKQRNLFNRDECFSNLDVKASWKDDEFKKFKAYFYDINLNDKEIKEDIQKGASGSLNKNKMSFNMNTGQIKKDKTKESQFKVFVINDDGEVVETANNVLIIDFVGHYSTDKNGKGFTYTTEDSKHIENINRVEVEVFDKQPVEPTDPTEEFVLSVDDQDMPYGYVAEFTAKINGTDKYKYDGYTYQWYRNGELLSDQTDYIYVTDWSKPTDNEDIVKCVVTEKATGKVAETTAVHYVHWEYGKPVKEDVKVYLQKNGNLNITGSGNVDTDFEIDMNDTLTDGNWDRSIVIWRDYAHLIKSVTMEDAVKPVDMSGWFEDCVNLSNDGLKNFTIPDSVKSMVNTFDGCTSLKETPKLPDSVEYMIDTFKDCKNLTSITNIPDKTGFMIGTFENCTSLKHVQNLDKTNITKMDRTFKGSGLTEIPLLPEKVVVVKSVFEDCISATSIEKGFEIPETVLNLNGIYYQNILKNCPSLSGVITIRSTGESGDYTTPEGTHTHGQYMMEGTATKEGTQIILNYDDEDSEYIAQREVERYQWLGNNVIKGSLIEK